MLLDILNNQFLGNSYESYLWFFGIVFVGLVLHQFVSKVLAQFVFRFLKKYSTGVAFEKLFNLIKRPLRIFILLITFYFAFDQLSFPQSWHLVSRNNFGLRMFLYRGFQAGIIISVTWMMLRMVDYFGLVLMYKASLTESKSDDQLIPFLKESIKVIVVILSLFFTLGLVFKLNVASLIAGLGIGGIAIALAAKETLENLIGSFTIFLDKPFLVGDLVQIGNVTGTIEKIGFRSTRIRTLEKSLVTIPNKKMVDGDLENLTLRTHRRVKYTIGLTYNSPKENIKKVVEEVQTLFNTHAMIDKAESRVRFLGFGNSSLEVFVDYYINTNNTDTFINIRQEINFLIMEIISKNNCEFAYPTSTIHIASNKS